MSAGCFVDDTVLNNNNNNKKIETLDVVYKTNAPVSGGAPSALV